MLTLITKHDQEIRLAAEQMSALRECVERARTHIVQVSLDGTKAQSRGGKRPGLVFICERYSNRVPKKLMPELADCINAVEAGEEREFLINGERFISSERLGVAITSSEEA